MRAASARRRRYVAYGPFGAFGSIHERSTKGVIHDGRKRTSMHYIEVRQPTWLNLMPDLLPFTQPPIRKVGRRGPAIPRSDQAWVESTPAGVVEYTTKELVASGTVPLRLHLPIVDDNLRVTPNALVLSALWAVFGKGKRRELNNDLIAAVDGVCLEFTGWQFDKGDQEVFQTVVHLARRYGHHSCLGTRYEFTARELLRAMGHKIGTSSEAWVEQSLYRLTQSRLKLADSKRTFIGSLFDKLYHDKLGKRYVVVINRDLDMMFAGNYTRLNWEERSRLRKHPLALWVYDFLSASFSKKVTLTVRDLWNFCGSTNTSFRSFQAELKKALASIKTETTAITDWKVDETVRRVEDRSVTIEHPLSPEKEKWLEKKKAGGVAAHAKPTRRSRERAQQLSNGNGT